MNEAMKLNFRFIDTLWKGKNQMRGVIGISSELHKTDFASCENLVFAEKKEWTCQVSDYHF